jgi:hypothetical protein
LDEVEFAIGRQWKRRKKKDIRRRKADAKTPVAYIGKRMRERERESEAF